MKRLYKIGLLVLFLAGAFGGFRPGALFAQYERPGSSTGQFLKLGVSPRATAMGNAYMAVANGAEATYYNPAVLARLDGLVMTANHTDWFANINLDFAAAAYNVKGVGSFGLSVTSLMTDIMKVRTPLQPEGTGEEFVVSNQRFGVSYSRILTNHVSFGGTINYIRLSLYDDFAQWAVASDIAVLYVTSLRDFKFGMKISNFGSSITYVNEQYPLPLSFNFGMGINAIEGKNQVLQVSLSGKKPNDGQTLLRGGAEYQFMNFAFLRGGYQFNHDLASYSLGAGLQFEITGRSIRFDYSLNDYTKLGAIHRFGLSTQL